MLVEEYWKLRQTQLSHHSLNVSWHGTLFGMLFAQPCRHHTPTEQEQAFTKVKQLLAEALILAFYYVSKPTIVSCGLGDVLLQDHNEQLHRAAYCVLSLTDAKKNKSIYNTDWKEVFGCGLGMWECEKFSKCMYTLNNFTIQTDHKLSPPFYKVKDIDTVPLCCQRLPLRMMEFNAKAEYIFSGKLLVVADTLLKTPFCCATPRDNWTDILALEEDTRAAWLMSSSHLDEVEEHTKDDLKLQMVMHFVSNAWSKYASKLPGSIKSYYTVKDSHLTCCNLLLYGHRIAILKCLRPQIVE